MDMEKLAENLQRVNEDDLLLVVQMIHDNKTGDSWIRNDVERKLHCSQHLRRNRALIPVAEGEFQVDLYTLPDSLIRQLWDFTTEKLGGR